MKISKKSKKAESKVSLTEKSKVLKALSAKEQKYVVAFGGGGATAWLN